MRKLGIALLALSQAMPLQVFAQSSTTPPKTIRLVIGDISIPSEDLGKRPAVREAMLKAFSHEGRIQIVPEADLKRIREQLSTTKKESQEQLRQARELLTNGKAAYQKLKFGAAITALSEARRFFIANLHELRSNRDLLDSHLYLGMAYTAVGKNAEAEEEFRKVVYLDSKRELTSKEFSPRIIELFAEARRDVLAEESVKVRVESEPDGGAVYLNGRSMGRTPITLDLQAGSYFILVEKEGTLPWYKPLEFRRRVETVHSELTPDAGDIRWTRLFRIREGAEQQSSDVGLLGAVARQTRADMIFLGTILHQKNYRLLGQLYDSRTAGFSQVAVVTVGEDLGDLPAEAGGVVDTLMGFIRPDGYLTVEKSAGPTLKSEKIPVAAGPSPAEQISASPIHEKPWYTQWWIWPLVVGVGVGIYFGASELGSSKGSTVVIDNSGNF